MNTHNLVITSETRKLTPEETQRALETAQRIFDRRKFRTVDCRLAFLFTDLEKMGQMPLEHFKCLSLQEQIAISQAACWIEANEAAVKAATRDWSVDFDDVYLELEETQASIDQRTAKAPAAVETA